MAKSLVASLRAQEIIRWFSPKYPLSLKMFCRNLDINIEDVAITKDGYLCCLEGIKAIFVRFTST